MSQIPVYSQKSHLLPSIDVLRGVAVLGVLLFHFKLPIGVDIIDNFLIFMHTWGWSGVDLFFVISGFCIHWGYGDHNRPFRARDYLLRRFRRIYPPYIFALLVSTLALGTGIMMRSRSGGIGPELEAVSLWQVLTHMLLIHNVWPETVGGINLVFRTIAVEFQFYVIYLAFRPWMRGRAWLGVLAVSIGIHMLAWMLPSTAGATPWHVFRYWIEWVMGALIADLYRRKSYTKAWWVPLLAGVVVLLILWLTRLQMVLLDTVARPIWALAYTMIVLGALWGPQEVWQNLAMKPVLRLGLISYSVYLIHLSLTQRIGTYVIMRLEPGIIRLIGYMVSLAVIISLCRVFYCLFERPFLNTSRVIGHQAAVLGPVSSIRSNENEASH